MTSTSASSRKNQALSKIACNRLQKELVEWQVNPPAGFKHKPTDNLQRWVIEVRGAPGTLYANETFQLQVDFPEHYPMEAPQVIFLHPAPLHPHIYSNGHICLAVYSCLTTAGQISGSVYVMFLEKLKGCQTEKKRTGITAVARLLDNRHLWRMKNAVVLFITTHDGNILYDSWSPAMTVSSICISILSMLSSSTVKQAPEDNDRYVRNCKNGRSPKETRWWFHDDKV